MIKIQKTNPTGEILNRYVKEGKMNFDLPMQRGYVWTREKKSKLIESILLGYPVPPLYANFKSGIYYIVDGQQRGKTISDFQQDKFSLSQLAPIVLDGQDYDVSGKKFQEIPEKLRELIEQFNLDLHYGENMSDEQQKEMFIRLNSGKPLSSTEMTKAQIKSLAEVTALSKHNVFKKIMNEKGIEASKNASLVMQTYVAIYEPYKCLRSSAIKDSLGETQITSEQQAHINNCLDVFEEIYNKVSIEKSDISKKLGLVFKRKAHFIAFIYTISQALNSNSCELNILESWIKHFFNSDVDKTTISDEYNSRLKDAMNSDESVQIRLKAMYNDYLNYNNTQDGR